MVERYVMEVGSDTRELVERLRQWDGCWPAPGLDHDVERAADIITALSERVRALEEAVEAVIQFHNSTFSGPCAAQNKGRQWKGVLRKCLNARAALTSGGRG